MSVKTSFFLVLFLPISALFAAVEDGLFLKGILEGGGESPNEKERRERRKVALYRGIIEEGENLENFCRDKRPIIRYADEWRKDQSIRSTIATVQLIGLETTTKAIAKYAQYFDFQKPEYQNLVDNLVGNYCSKNISVVSLKKLKKNMVDFFDDNDFIFPGTEFLSSLGEDFREHLPPEREYRKNEMRLTLELFKIFCSWGGVVHDTKLLAPLLRNPVWMSFVGRHISSQRLEWNEDTNTFFLSRANGRTRVICHNFVCRRTGDHDFERSFYYSVGTLGIRDDFNRLYCDHFRVVDFNYRHPDGKIKEMIHDLSFDDLNLLNAQMMALVTGFPDLFVMSQTLEKTKKAMGSGVEYYWKRWAKIQGGQRDHNLTYEESFTIEPSDRNLYFNPQRNRFRVEFDVNMGEFDRAYQRVGKITIDFDLKISKKSLHYFADSWRKLAQGEEEKKEQLRAMFEKRIARSVEEVRKKFNIPLWKTGLEKLIVGELLEQFKLYRGTFPTRVQGHIHLPMRFHLSLFALGYMRDKFLVKEKV